VAAPAKVELSTLQILDLARESELGRLAALEQVQQQQAQLALAAPKVAFVDRYVVATGLKGFREVCKLLGANEARFVEFLTDSKILYRLGGVLTPHAPHLDAKRFVVRAGVSEITGHAFNSMKFTTKGIEWVAGEWAKHLVRAEVAA
jgi:phage antirepressor YoqD-like protein